MISIDKGVFSFSLKKHFQKVCKYLFLRDPFILLLSSKGPVMGLQKKMINEPKEPGLKLSHSKVVLLFSRHAKSLNA